MTIVKERRCAIQVANGCFVTAVNKGGIVEANRLPIHTDSKHIDSWEYFTLCFLDNGKCAIRTASGNYLTAVDNGGKGDPTGKSAICTDAKSVGENEKFKFIFL